MGTAAGAAAVEAMVAMTGVAAAITGDATAETVDRMMVGVPIATAESVAVMTEATQGRGLPWGAGTAVARRARRTETGTAAAIVRGRSAGRRTRLRTRPSIRPKLGVKSPRRRRERKAGSPRAKRLAVWIRGRR